MVGAILSGLLGVGSTVANHFVNRSNLEDARAYNSPAAQMARLRKAGINPYTQAANGQLDNTLGQVQDSNFEGIGDSANASLEGFTRREQMRLNKTITEQQLQLAQERIRGVELDNQFKQATLVDRAAIISSQLQLSHLDGLIKDGIISQQEYENRVRAVQANLQEYLSGKSATMFGQPVTVDDKGFTGIPLVDEVVSGINLRKEQTNKIHEDYKFLLDTHEDRVNYQNYHTWREWYAKEYEGRTLEDRVKLTEHQAAYWFNRAVREEIAADYEQVTGMPWMNKDLKTHVITRLISAIGHAWNAGYDPNDKEFYWSRAFNAFIKEFTNADIPIEDMREDTEWKRAGGAGGTF